MLHLQLKTVRPWTMAGKVANTYQVGRTLLVGDSAHMFPPSGAFGMNTGVQVRAGGTGWAKAGCKLGRTGSGQRTLHPGSEAAPHAFARPSLCRALCLTSLV